MNLQITLYLSLLLILALDLLTIAACSGLRNASLAKVLQLREETGEQADRILTLMNLSPRPYVGMHFFQTVCRFLLIGIVFNLIYLVQNSPSIFLSAVVLLVAGIVVALLEWIVEQYVAQDPEKWFKNLGLFIQIIGFIFSPLISLSVRLSREQTSHYDSVGVVTEDELKLMVEAGQQEGVLEQEEGQMIFSIFQLGDTLTREIMVPRIEMLAIDIITPFNHALNTLLDSGYSRVPVYEGRVDNVIGILYAKDLLNVWRDGNGGGDDIRSLLREPYFVPEAKKAYELLAGMQHRRVHMAIVIDEYGGVAGVVTLEDIVEEILGEIQDEYDVEDMPYQLLEDGSYLFRGRIDLDDFNQVMDSSLPPEDADTLSGFIYGRLGHVPVTGESVEFENLNLSVEQVSNRRIRLVRARRLVPDGGSDVE
jgi:CBS domain containing-hemolysin-like protein